jgi:DNA-binding transcriptional LysR family regulator
MTRLDILGLQAFVSIAERGSFRAAAAHLNLSQTALSHRIRKLETGLGVSLFSRSTRQVALTASGVELLPKARKLLEDMGAALDRLREQALSIDERVVLGCLPTIALVCLPGVLAAFKRAHPDTVVKIFDGSASEIADRVQSGDADFGISIMAANRWSLDVRPLVSEPFVLVCRRDDALAERRSVRWADVDGLPLIRISAETGNRILIDDALGSRRDLLSWRYEVQRVTTAVALVRSGVGYAVVPKLALQAMDSAALARVELVSPGVNRKLGVITRKGSVLSERAGQLLGLLSDALAGEIARK